MVHYILFKFKEGVNIDECFTKMQDTFAKLEKELPCLHNPAIYRNIIERDTNADILLKLEFDSKEDLPVYLNHPLHVQLAKSLNDSIATRISFDCN